MYLTENQLIQKMADIKEGDWVSIVGEKAQMHCTVESKFGSELLLKNSDTKHYRIYTSTAIEGDKITLHFINFPKPPKEITSVFKSIIISDKNRKEKFKILPQAPGGPDPEIEKKIIEDCKKNRDEIMKDLGDLKQFSEFSFLVGDYIFDADGDAVIKDGTESIIKFKVDSFNANLYNCSLESASGKYRKLFNKYKDEEFYIFMNSKLLNTSPQFEKNVALQIWHESDTNTPIILKDVYSVDIMDGQEVEDGEDQDEEEDEDSVDTPRSMEDMLKDKDLMKLMNYQTVWDKALGRKAKGIKPMNDLKGKDPLSTLFGFNKKAGQKVTFVYLGDTLRGHQLSLRRGETYNGIMRDSNTIQLSVRNSKEKIYIAFKDKILKDNKRNAAVSYKKPDGYMDHSKEMECQIQITK